MLLQESQFYFLSYAFGQKTMAGMQTVEEEKRPCAYEMVKK